MFWVHGRRLRRFLCSSSQLTQLGSTIKQWLEQVVIRRLLRSECLLHAQQELDSSHQYFRAPVANSTRITVKSHITAALSTPTTALPDQTRHCLDKDKSTLACNRRTRFSRQRAFCRAGPSREGETHLHLAKRNVSRQKRPKPALTSNSERPYEGSSHPGKCEFLDRAGMVSSIWFSTKA